MPRALILSLVPSFAYKVAACLHDAGIRSHVMGETRIPYGWLSRYIDRYHRLDVLEVSGQPEKIADFVETWCARHDIDVVLAADLVFAKLLAKHGDRIRSARVFPLSSPETLEAMHNKWAFAQFLETHGLPAPATRYIETRVDIDTLDLAYPIIVKPLQGSDSLGVEKILDAQGFHRHVDTGVYGTELPLLAQAFIEGHDIDLNLLAEEGEILAWSVQRRESYLSKTMQFLFDDAVLELGRKIVRAAGFHGVGHIDFRVATESDELQTIEFNPRFWGSVQYSAWCGVNFPWLAFEQAMGRDPARNFRPVTGNCENPGFSTRALMGCLAKGRLTPEGLSEPTRAAWRSNYADPLPHVLRKATTVFERYASTNRLFGG